MMRTRLLSLLAAVAVCAGLYVAQRAALQIGPAHTDLAAATEGHVTEGGGWFKGEPFETARPVRAWGSWTGSDANTGSVTIGPFPAPALLRVAMGGYPKMAKLPVHVERTDTGERVPFATIDVGERWRIVDCPLPAAWQGRPVRLVAVDNATGLGGWFGITEPLRGGRGDGHAALLETLATWAANGVLLGLLLFVAAGFITRRGWVPAPWVPLAAVGAVAVAGYLVFWAWFGHRTLGTVVSGAILCAGLVGLILQRSPFDAAARSEVRAVARLALAIGGFYLGLLHLYPSSLDFYQLAAQRYRSGLPVDNELPHDVADRLQTGKPLRRADADWLSSDRPPLQSGWQLLTLPVLTPLGFSPRTVTGTSALWFQLAWVAAAWGLFRTLGLAARRAAGWTALLALSGFFVQNSAFTWPKLAAGAFACGAFALWVLPRPEKRGPRAIVAGAVFASLGWLAHGGVAFSYLVLAPWIFWRMLRGEWRPWLVAAAIFAVFAGPWSAYQKLYDPPGNRLLKWHLGGQVDKDPRGVGQTIRENYAALDTAKIAEKKQLNFAYQIASPWSDMLAIDAKGSQLRRSQEFFHTARALTWWILGFLVFPFAWARAARDADGGLGRMHLALLLWPLATVPVWCLLLFDGGSAVIHQGSYAVMIVLFVLLSAWFEAAHRRWLWLVGALQTFTFIFTWAGPNAVIGGAMQPFALGVTLAGAAGLAAFLVAALRTADEPAAPLPAPAAAAPAGPPLPAWRDRALPWVGAALALTPLVWGWRAFADLWWFGDDWDLLERIDRIGFARWTLEPFAENVVPLFKGLWGGLVFASGGSYLPMILALWLTHALNTALLARILLRAGLGRPAVGLAVVLFALSAANVETLAWSVQWSALLAIAFFLLAADLLQRRLAAGTADRAGTLAWLALLSAASALTFARGVLSGGALAAVMLLPFGLAAALRVPARLKIAAACLLPAVAVVGTILLVSQGNHRALGGHTRAMAEFAVAYWSGTPLLRLLGFEAWTWHGVALAGLLKLGLVAWTLRVASPAQRWVLLVLLVLDLGNALLLGIGRHHTGVASSNSERYQYNALLCTLPFLAVAFGQSLRAVPVVLARRVVASLALVFGAWWVGRTWPAAAEHYANHRGRNTRELLLRHPAPPAENAVPGIPFLPTARAKELIEIYGLK